jgi:hypothetical protein
VDIAGEKKLTPVSGQGCQGLRSRGGHVWPPCLEGPDRFTDTMDVAGPLGPAWMRLCLTPRSMDQLDCVLRKVWTSGVEVSGSEMQLCDSVCGHSPVGLEGEGALRVGVTGAIGVRRNETSSRWGVQSGLPSQTSLARSRLMP